MQNVGVRALIENLDRYLSGTAQMDRANAQIGKSAESASLMSNKAFLALNVGAAAVTGAFVAAAAKAAQFEHAMAGIQAVSGASAAQMKQLSDAALTAGKQFGFTATETASAEEALIKAGVSITDVLGGALPAALTLAAAGSIDVQAAAEIGANALNQFSLKGTDMKHVADLIAGAANASAIDVKDFGLSLQQAGAVAATAGQTIDSTSEAIAVLGSAGIKSSDAGTSLKTMLMNLQPQSKNAAELMKFLGLMTKDGANAFFDAEGKVKSFKDIAGVLQTSLKDLTEQQKLATLSIIFGSDAARAAAVFAREGAAGFEEMHDSMAKVSAEDVAGKRLDSLQGDLDKLKVALDGVAVKAGKETTPELRNLTQELTKLVENVTPNAVTAIANITSGLAGIAQFGAAATGSVDALGKALSILGPLTPALSGIGAALQIGGALLEPGQLGTTTTTGPGITDIAQGLKDAQARAKALARPLQDFSDLQAAADGTKKFTAAVSEASPEAARLRAELDRLLASLRDGKGGGVTGGAKEAKTALQEFGIGLDDIRRAGEAARLSQETIDAAILAVGGSILDTGPIVEGYGKTVTRLAAAFDAAGLNGKELVAIIQEQNAAAKAQQEAEKAAAKAERERQEEERRAEEARRKAEEDAKRAREAVIAGIVGTATRDTLGTARGRTPKDAAQAAADFNAAASGLDAIAKAGLDTDVALDLMEKRLGNLAGQFAALSGDDLASAGATTDGIRKLIQAFRDGTIGVEEFNAGISKFGGELGRLGGVVDETAAKFRKFDEDNAARVAQDAINSATDRATSALQLQRDELDHGLGPAWARVGKTMTTAMADFLESIRLAQKAVDELIAKQNIIIMRQQQDQDSGQRAREAAARFTAGFEGAEDKGAFLQEILATSGRIDDIFQLVFFGAINQLLKVAPVVGQSLASAIAAALGLSGGIDSFGNGGIVSGPLGMPRLIMAHAGETVIPRRPDLVMLPPTTSPSARYDRSVTYNLTANYSNPQEPQNIRYELQTLAMLAGR